MKIEPQEWTLLPPAPEYCQECAEKHEAEAPHNAMSLYYQIWFRKKHARWPDWQDAMAHCTDEVKEQWRALLRERDIDVDAGQLTPMSPKGFAE